MKIRKFLKVPVILGLTVTMAVTASAATQKGTVSKTVTSHSATLEVSNGYGSTSGAYIITSPAGVGFELDVVENTAVIQSLAKSDITGSIWSMNSSGGVMPGANATLTYGVYGASPSSYKTASIVLQPTAPRNNGKNIQVKDKQVTIRTGKNHPYAKLKVTY